MGMRSGGDVTLGVLHAVCKRYGISGEELEADQLALGPPSQDLVKFANVSNPVRRCVLIYGGMDGLACLYPISPHPTRLAQLIPHTHPHPPHHPHTAASRCSRSSSARCTSWRAASASCAASSRPVSPSPHACLLTPITPSHTSTD